MAEFQWLRVRQNAFVIFCVDVRFTSSTISVIIALQMEQVRFGFLWFAIVARGGIGHCPCDTVGTGRTATVLFWQTPCGAGKQRMLQQ